MWVTKQNLKLFDEVTVMSVKNPICLESLGLDAQEDATEEDLNFFIKKQIIVSLSEELTKVYRKGFDKSSLHKFARFYKMYPKIVDSVNLQFGLLSQIYYRTLLQVEDSEARQQYIHTEKEDYYIALVFYNYILKCFVLIVLKTNKIINQDVGRMDMYIRMCVDLKKAIDEDIAKYSVLHDNEQLFASKYKLFLYIEEELRA